MKTVESKLKIEVTQLKRIVQSAKKRVEKAPKGKLRIRKRNEVLEYYYNDSDDSYNNGRYLKRSERGFAGELAQRDYDLQVIKHAEERIKAIEKFLHKYEKTSLKELYCRLNPSRRELVSASVISDEEYVKRWLERDYIGKTFQDEQQEIISEQGKRVRSKSEKIIADKLYYLEIPYLYEFPLVLAGNITFYPDFTILKMPERKVVYLEHFGMVDDPKYAEKAIAKLKTYERNGIYLGVNLFITFETSSSPLNTRAMDEMLRKIFCEE